MRRPAPLEWALLAVILISATANAARLIATEFMAVKADAEGNADGRNN